MVIVAAVRAFMEGTIPWKLRERVMKNAKSHWVFVFVKQKTSLDWKFSFKRKETNFSIIFFSFNAEALSGSLPSSYTELNVGLDDRLLINAPSLINRRKRETSSRRAPQ